MAETQKIVILDFGGQYTQLIARRVRECKVYSEVLPYHASVEQIRAIGPQGDYPERRTGQCAGKGRTPVRSGHLGTGCAGIGHLLGMQLTAHLLGGTVEKAAKRNTADPV